MSETNVNNELSNYCLINNNNATVSDLLEFLDSFCYMTLKNISPSRGGTQFNESRHHRAGKVNAAPG